MKRMAPSSENRTMTICTPESFHLLNESGRREEICAWLRANNLDPNDVSADAPITVDDADGQLVIRYVLFLRDAAGHKYVDPEDGHRAAQEQRTTPCAVEPPAHWDLGDCLRTDAVGPSVHGGGAEGPGRGQTRHTGA